MKINFSNILWRTRGKKWDYTFLTTPRNTNEIDWYNFHANVFNSIEAETHVININGNFIDQNNQFFYAATAFTDDSFIDKNGRTIAHYIIYLDEDESRVKALPIDWGKQFLKSMLANYQSCYDIDETENGFFEITRYFPESSLNIDIQGGTEVATTQGFTSRLNIVSPPQKSSNDSSQKATATRKTEFHNSKYTEPTRKDLALLEKAIFHGQVYALKIPESLTSIDKVGASSKENENKIEKLAKSFCCDDSDEFLIRQEWKSSLGVLMRYVSRDTRNGFTAIIDALQSMDYRINIYDSSAEQKIAELVNASEKDSIVRNIKIRLKRLSEDGSY